VRRLISPARGACRRQAPSSNWRSSSERASPMVQQVSRRCSYRYLTIDRDWFAGRVEGAQMLGCAIVAKLERHDTQFVRRQVTPRPYQLEGRDFLAGRWHALLADEMRVGKSPRRFSLRSRSAYATSSSSAQRLPWPTGAGN